MAASEALGAPDGDGAVSGEAAVGSGQPEALARATPATTPGHVQAPRLCKVCGQPVGIGERTLHRGRCAHVRRIELQKVRRRRSRG